MKRRTPYWLCVAAVVAAAVVVVIFFIGRGTDQAQVGAGALPVVSTAAETSSFIDCSTIGPVSYNAHQPCQTFVLLQSSRYGSAQAFLAAEERQLLTARWRHPAAPVLVDGDSGNYDAPIAESWAAPHHQACAFLTTAAAGVSAEAREILPYDQYNTPRGLLDFYRAAKTIAASNTLWARLQPAYINGQRVC
jgi:hypothetical protein